MDITFEVLPHPRFSYIMHSVAASNTQHGFQAVIVPPGAKTPDHFGLPVNTSSSKTAVFLQSCEPFNVIPKYNHARKEAFIQITMDDYLALLHYWANTHSDIRTQMMHQAKAISHSGEGITITPHLQFFNSVIISYTHVLNKSCKLNAWLEPVVNPETLATSYHIYVRLTKEDKRFYVPEDPMNLLVQEKESLEFLQRFHDQVMSSVSANTSSSSSKSPKKHARKE